MSSFYQTAKLRLLFVVLMALTLMACGKQGSPLPTVATPTDSFNLPVSPWGSPIKPPVPTVPLASTVPEGTPTWEPIAWVGPLLYPIDTRHQPEVFIPVYDLGAGKIHRLTVHEPVARVLDWSSDGCYVAYVAAHEPRRIHIVNIYTLEDIPLPASAAMLRWSPDGEWIAYGYYFSPLSEMYLIRPDGTGSRQLTHNNFPDVLQGWSIDGKKVLYWSYYPNPKFDIGEIRELKIFDMTSSQELVVVRFPLPLKDWSELSITNLSTMKQIRIKIADKPQNVRDMVLFWTPDFQHFALFTAEDFVAEAYVGAKLYWVDLEEEQVQTINTTGFGLSYDFAQSPDGTRLAFNAVLFDEESAEYYRTYLLDMTIGTVKLLSSKVERFWYPAWAPDGTMLSYIAYADAQSRAIRAIYNLVTNEVTPLPEALQDYAGRGPLYWSPRISYQVDTCQGRE
ncbi:MAG: TolB family protein [Chloroflexia bacterium]